MIKSLDTMKTTIQTLAYMALLLGIGLVFSFFVYLLQKVIGDVGTLLVMIVGLFFLIRFCVFTKNS